MIVFMPKSQDGWDNWSWVHLFGGMFIAGIASIWLRPFWAFALTVLCGVLYECRDALYANVLKGISFHHKKILGRRLGAHYNNYKINCIVFWMADPRGASKWDIYITGFGGMLCALFVRALFY